MPRGHQICFALLDVSICCKEGDVPDPVEQWQGSWREAHKSETLWQHTALIKQNFLKATGDLGT